MSHLKTGPLTIAIADGPDHCKTELDEVCAMDIIFANKALANVAETVAENHPDQMSSFACAQRIVALLLSDRMQMSGAGRIFQAVDEPEEAVQERLSKEAQE